MTLLKRALLLGLLLLHAAAPPEALGQSRRTEIPSSFNPVGSGARALGMGGAFVAVADDATAASWNPGALVQLELPEVSAVGAYTHRGEDLRFGFSPESDGPQRISQAGLNYLSFAYPLVLFHRNTVLSVNYQHLFDLNRRWVFDFEETGEESLLFPTSGRVENDQDGGLYALGLACGVQVLPELSLGLTLNLWEDFLYENRWRKTHREAYRMPLSGSDIPALVEEESSESFSFRGFNFNAGVLWRVTDKLTLGAVFKSPFTADLDYRGEARFRTEYPFAGMEPSENVVLEREKQELDMPMSYGVGVAWRFSDAFTLSADFHRTHWQDFAHRDADGEETDPVSGLPVEEADVSATHQARLGAEYLFIRRKHVVPVRGGAFYDPAPAKGSPDDYFGFSLGSGISTNRFSLDFAYQYRFGRSVGGSVLESLDFSQDTDEHTFYTSFILYLF